MNSLLIVDALFDAHCSQMAIKTLLRSKAPPFRSTFCITLCRLTSCGELMNIDLTSETLTQKYRHGAQRKIDNLIQKSAKKY
jgi:hypothetical protein